MQEGGGERFVRRNGELQKGRRIENQKNGDCRPDPGEKGTVFFPPTEDGRRQAAEEGGEKDRSGSPQKAEETENQKTACRGSDQIAGIELPRKSAPAGEGQGNRQPGEKERDRIDKIKEKQVKQLPAVPSNPREVERNLVSDDIGGQSAPGKKPGRPGKVRKFSAAEKIGKGKKESPAGPVAQKSDGDDQEGKMMPLGDRQEADHGDLQNQGRRRSEENTRENACRNHRDP